MPHCKGKFLFVLKQVSTCYRAVLLSQAQGTMLAATTLAPGCLGQQPETNKKVPLPPVQPHPRCSKARVLVS